MCSLAAIEQGRAHRLLRHRGREGEPVHALRLQPHALPALLSGTRHGCCVVVMMAFHRPLPSLRGHKRASYMHRHETGASGSPPLRTCAKLSHDDPSSCHHLSSCLHHPSSGRCPHPLEQLGHQHRRLPVRRHEDRRVRARAPGPSVTTWHGAHASPKVVCYPTSTSN